MCDGGIHAHYEIQLRYHCGCVAEVVQPRTQVDEVYIREFKLLYLCGGLTLLQ